MHVRDIQCMQHTWVSRRATYKSQAALQMKGVAYARGITNGCPIVSHTIGSLRTNAGNVTVPKQTKCQEKMLSFHVDIIVVVCCVEVLDLAKKEENRGLDLSSFAALESLAPLLYILNSFHKHLYRTKELASA